LLYAQFLLQFFRQEFSPFFGEDWDIFDCLKFTEHKVDDLVLTQFILT
jgi:hypothetical protein